MLTPRMSAARRLAALILGVSMGGFLVAYARAGFPDSPLRAIALADLLMAPVLAIVAAHAFRAQPTAA
jgi:hypothetical protein